MRRTGCDSTYVEPAIIGQRPSAQNLPRHSAQPPTAPMNRAENSPLSPVPLVAPPLRNTPTPRPRMFRRKRTWLGCAIGVDMVRIVHLTRSAGVTRVSAVASHPVGPDPDHDDDARPLTASLERLRALHPQLPRRAAVALPSARVLVKRIEVSPMTDVELAAVINWEAERQLDIEPDEYRIDCTPLSSGGTEPRAVLVAAVRKTYADACAYAFRQAGLNVEILDAAPAALHNAYAANYDSTHAVLVDGDSTTTTVHVISDSTPRLTRTIAGSAAADTARAVEAALAEANAERPCPVFVSGTMCRDPRRTTALADRLSSPVEPLNPFHRLRFDGPELELGVASEFAVACGAGLRLTEA